MDKNKLLTYGTQATSLGAIGATNTISLGNL